MLSVQILLSLVSLTSFASCAAHAPYVVLKKDDFKTQIAAQLDRDLRVEEQQCWVFLMGNTTELSKEVQNNEFFDAVNTKTDDVFAMIDCDIEAALCHSWLASPPYVMHVRRQAQAAGSDIELRRLPLNQSDLARPSLTKLVETNAWQNAEMWDGFLNPYTGALGKYGAGIYWGEFYKVFSKVPTWLIVGLILVVGRRVREYIIGDRELTSAADMVVPPGSLDPKAEDGQNASDEAAAEKKKDR